MHGMETENTFPSLAVRRKSLPGAVRTKGGRRRYTPPLNQSQSKSKIELLPRGIVGESVTLPTIEEDGKHSTVDKDKKLLPDIFGSRERLGFFFHPFRKTKERRDGGTLAELGVEGHDIRATPQPRRDTPSRSSSVSLSRCRSSALSIRPSVEKRSSAVDQDVDSEDEDEEDGETVMELFTNLNVVLMCQSYGIPLEITKKDFTPGRLARPIFHCKRCMEHWTSCGKLPDDCQQEERLTRGPAIRISKKGTQLVKRFKRLRSEGMDAKDAMAVIKTSIINMGKSTGDDETKELERMDSDYFNVFAKEGDAWKPPPPPPKEDPPDDENQDGTDRRRRRRRSIDSFDSLDDFYDDDSFYDSDESYHFYSDGSYTGDFFDRSDDEERAGEQRSGEDAKKRDDRDRRRRERRRRKRYHNDPDDYVDLGVNADQTIGQLGEDGYFYPGTYTSDHHFVPYGRIGEDGQFEEGVLFKGLFYVGGRYSPEGSFYAGDEDGIEFPTYKEAQAQGLAGYIGSDGWFAYDGGIDDNSYDDDSQISLSRQNSGVKYYRRVSGAAPAGLPTGRQRLLPKGFDPKKFRQYRRTVQAKQRLGDGVGTDSQEGMTKSNNLRTMDRTFNWDDGSQESIDMYGQDDYDDDDYTPAKSLMRTPSQIAREVRRRSIAAGQGGPTLLSKKFNPDESRRRHSEAYDQYDNTEETRESREGRRRSEFVNMIRQKREMERRRRAAAGGTQPDSSDTALDFADDDERRYNERRRRSSGYPERDWDRSAQPGRRYDDEGEMTYDRRRHRKEYDHERGRYPHGRETDRGEREAHQLRRGTLQYEREMMQLKDGEPVDGRGYRTSDRRGEGNRADERGHPDRRYRDQRRRMSRGVDGYYDDIDDDDDGRYFSYTDDEDERYLDPEARERYRKSVSGGYGIDDQRRRKSMDYENKNRKDSLKAQHLKGKSKIMLDVSDTSSLDLPGSGGTSRQSSNVMFTGPDQGNNGQNASKKPRKRAMKKEKTAVTKRTTTQAHHSKQLEGAEPVIRHNPSSVMSTMDRQMSAMVHYDPSHIASVVTDPSQGAMITTTRSRPGSTLSQRQQSTARTGSQPPSHARISLTKTTQQKIPTTPSSRATFPGKPTVSKADDINKGKPAELPPIEKKKSEVSTEKIDIKVVETDISIQKETKSDAQSETKITSDARRSSLKPPSSPQPGVSPDNSSIDISVYSEVQREKIQLPPAGLSVMSFSPVTFSFYSLAPGHAKKNETRQNQGNRVPSMKNPTSTKNANKKAFKEIITEKKKREETKTKEVKKTSSKSSVRGLARRLITKLATPKPDYVKKQGPLDEIIEEIESESKHSVTEESEHTKESEVSVVTSEVTETSESKESQVISDVESMERVIAVHNIREPEKRVTPSPLIDRDVDVRTETPYKQTTHTRKTI